MLSPRQLKVLQALARSPATAKDLGVTVRTFRALEQRGLILIEKAGTTAYPRTVQATLTRAGRAVIEPLAS